MPELPEVQTVVDSLEGKIVGKTIEAVEIRNEKLIDNKPGEEFIKLAAGSRVEKIKRRGKYIIISLSSGHYLIVHLRMTGRILYFEDKDEIGNYDYIMFYFTDDTQLRIGSKRKFTRVYLVKKFEEAGGLAKLGPEPLEEEFDLDKFYTMFSTRRGKIKPLLLNQKFLAGIGNIYADEILFRAGIHPERTADTLGEEEIKKLYQSIKKVLKEGIKYRGTTKQDYVDAEGESGSYQDYLQVHDQEGSHCPKCRTKIERIKVGGRSSYFCLQCQPKEKG